MPRVVCLMALCVRFGGCFAKKMIFADKGLPKMSSGSKIFVIFVPVELFISTQYEK